jgi:hypothetical protein
MSSVLRSVAQIPASIKYLLVVINPPAVSTDTDLTDASCYAFTCNAGSFAGQSLIDSTSANAILVASGTSATGVDLTIAALYKDLGRQIVVYDPGSHLRVAVFREVQEVDGATTGGVPNDYPTAMFIKVWSASGAGVYVARAGPGA